MPTGYTAGIIEGEIKTFRDFATRCMRAFGGTMHMRDEPMDKEYEPRTPSDYYKKRINEINKEIKEIKNTSDKDLIKNERERLNDEIERSLNAIVEKQETRKQLESMLIEVKSWEPPTSDHVEFKKFMIRQLQTTINHDTQTKYDDERITEYRERLKNLDTIDLRSEKLGMLEQSKERYINNYEEEVQRCETANKWVEQLLNSFDDE